MRIAMYTFAVLGVVTFAVIASLIGWDIAREIRHPSTTLFCQRCDFRAQHFRKLRFRIHLPACRRTAPLSDTEEQS